MLQIVTFLFSQENKEQVGFARISGSNPCDKEQVGSFELRLRSLSREPRVGSNPSLFY